MEELWKMNRYMSQNSDTKEMSLKNREIKKTAEELAEYTKEKATPVIEDAAEVLKEKAIDELKKIGKEACVINARFLKPLDKDCILNNIRDKKCVVTIEDGTVVGGLGSKVEEVIFENRLNIKLEKFAYPDEFVKHGSVNEIEKKYGLDVGSIVECLNSQEKSIKIVNTSC